VVAVPGLGHYHGHFLNSQAKTGNGLKHNQTTRTDVYSELLYSDLYIHMYYNVCLAVDVYEFFYVCLGDGVGSTACFPVLTWYLCYSRSVLYVMDKVKRDRVFPGFTPEIW